MSDVAVRTISRMWKFAAVAAICIGASAVFYLSMPSNVAHAKPPLGRKWPSVQQISMDEIDHSTYDALLRKHVDGDGYVNYAAWKQSSPERQALQNYLAGLSRASARKPSSREARLAFWINAYNAVTLEGILQVYPTTSIRNHTSRFGGYNIWKQLPLQVGDGKYSLNQIEHEILRKTGEPRIHFAVVCASAGCPRLLNEAYTAEKLQHQLTANTKDFFSRSQNFRLDARNRTMYLSSILNWFAGDFGHTQTDRMTYLKPYLPADAQSIATNRRMTVKYLDYDWTLNDQGRRSTAPQRRKGRGSRRLE